MRILIDPCHLPISEGIKDALRSLAGRDPRLAQILDEDVPLYVDVFREPSTAQAFSNDPDSSWRAYEDDWFILYFGGGLRIHATTRPPQNLRIVNDPTSTLQ